MKHAWEDFTPEPKRDWDVQDDPNYWNDPERLRADTTRATVEEVRAYRYAGYGKDSFERDRKVEDILAYLTGHVRSARPLQVLEVGCGGGRMSLIFKFSANAVMVPVHMHLLDHALGAVEVAAHRVYHPNDGFETPPKGVYSCMDGSRIHQAFRGQQFDVIFTHTALQHNSGWKQLPIFESVAASLCEGGIFWLWNEKTFRSQEDREEKPAYFHDDRESAGRAEWWIDRIVRHGFELLEYSNASYVFRRMAR